MLWCVFGLLAARSAHGRFFRVPGRFAFLPVKTLHRPVLFDGVHAPPRSNAPSLRKSESMGLLQFRPTVTAARTGIVVNDASLAAFLSPETVVEPLNAATEPWIRALVWTDFRLAVTLFVVAPFMLLSWSVLACRPAALGGRERSATAEVALRYMTSYWQASSLLLITVALNIQEDPLGVPTGLIAQAMIIVSLWWWKDLNGEMQSARPST